MPADADLRRDPTGALELLPPAPEPGGGDLHRRAGKRAGDDMQGEDVELTARRQQADEKSPYERLLGDALRGDAGLFTSETGRASGRERGWQYGSPPGGA